jgi:hypothetical protein
LRELLQEIEKKFFVGKLEDLRFHAGGLSAMASLSFFFLANVA